MSNYLSDKNINERARRAYKESLHRELHRATKFKRKLLRDEIRAVDKMLESGE